MRLSLIPFSHRPSRITQRIRRLIALAGTVFAVVAITLVTGAGQAAAVEVSTDYPVVNVQAGQSVSLDLKLTSKTVQRVGLSIAQSPAGWKAELQGGGFTIGGVYVGPDETPSVQLQVQVPGDAKTGQYHVTVDATAPDGTTKLDVQLNVVQQASNAFTLTSQFDKLQGGTSDTFDFDLTLANNTGKKATFGLTAQGPQGWTVTASPSSESKASAVEVDAGSTATVSVDADPPDSVSAGNYPVTVTAQGQGIELHAKLIVEVTGSAKLSVATANQVLNASGSAGDSTDVHLVLSNTGTAPLQGLSLSSSPPSGWKVTFDPSTVPTIAAGKTADVVAHIVPADDAITGDYQVTLSANSDASSGSVDIRYTVQTSSWWGLIGVVIIAIVVVALLWLFRRFGRR
jgi:uncharacterized membrane protein